MPGSLDSSIPAGATVLDLQHCTSHDAPLGARVLDAICVCLCDGWGAPTMIENTILRDEKENVEEG